MAVRIGRVASFRVAGDPDRMVPHVGVLADMCLALGERISQVSEYGDLWHPSSRFIPQRHRAGGEIAAVDEL